MVKNMQILNVKHIIQSKHLKREEFQKHTLEAFDNLNHTERLLFVGDSHDQMLERHFTEVIVIANITDAIHRDHFVVVFFRINNNVTAVYGSL